MSTEEYTGVCSGETVADYENELRTTNCVVCGAQEVTEVATLNGLETVVKCQDCGYEYCRRGEK